MPKLKNIRALLALSLLALAAPAHSRSAPEYYHEGATNYVHGHWARAKAAVTNGLALFPKDEKLLALNKLLEQPPQQQQQQEQQQDQDKKDQQEQKDQQSKQNQQQQQQEQEKKEEPQPQQDQQKSSDKKEESQPKNAGEGDQKGAKEPGGSAMQPLQMTQEQAQRLLDAVKTEEKVMIFTPQFKTNRNNRALKDW